MLPPLWKGISIPVTAVAAMAGWYGVPQTIYGCPKQGWRSLVEITFNGHNFRQRQRTPDVAGPIVDATLTLGVCVSAGVGGEGEGRVWPPGQYCMYRIGTDCPVGELYIIYYFYVSTAYTGSILVELG